jgi:hypothetical protein
MTKKRTLLKKNILLAALVITLTLEASLTMENTHAATPAPTPEPTATSKPSPTPVATSKFAYQAEGNQKSSLPAPKTITLCNYTTPPDIDTITQISIRLTGIPEGSQVRAIILPNDPDSNMPQVGEPLLQTYAINVTSISGEWYNFKINYTASPNTVYWLGYYTDNNSQYFFDTNNDHISLTSQTKDENSTLFPVLSWRYTGKTIMSLYAEYTIADPQHTPTPTNTPQHTPTPINTDSTISSSPGLAQSIQETFFVLLIMGAEATIVVSDQSQKKRTLPTNNNSNSTPIYKNPNKISSRFLQLQPQ